MAGRHRTTCYSQKKRQKKGAKRQNKRAKRIKVERCRGFHPGRHPRRPPALGRQAPVGDLGASVEGVEEIPVIPVPTRLLLKEGTTPLGEGGWCHMQARGWGLDGWEAHQY